MKNRKAIRRGAVAAALVSGGGFLLQNNGCVSFTAESALVATDFCFIFDCQNGLFGGTIDPCAPGGSVLDPVGGGPFFADCP
jgi:hypothetical protein